MTKKQIEEKLINMFWNQQTMEENNEEGVYFNGIENVKPFDGYLCTMDNGVVIDLSDGTEICLTIQTR